MVLAARKEIWALTSYFNPMRYRHRLENFRKFRESLSIPLIAAELSNDDSFELTSSDAERLLQFHSATVLWHKESLLNAALAQLPQHVRYVAWLDCDVLFQNKNWAKEAVESLKTFKLIQLFAELRDLSEEESRSPEKHAEAALNRSPTGRGVIHLANDAQILTTSFAPGSTQDMRTTSFGIAWAGHAPLMRKHGFYDAMIIGSGDRAMACAALGRIPAVTSALHLSPKRDIHYRNWATPYCESIAQSINCLPGSVLHLWHGDIQDRHYKQRHVDFSEFDFDPNRDLMRDGQGMWAWKTPSAEARDYLTRYFARRREDGHD